MTEFNRTNSFNILPEVESSYISKEYDLDEIRSMKGNWTEVCQLILTDRPMKQKNANCEYEQEYEEFRHRKD